MRRTLGAWLVVMALALLPAYPVSAAGGLDDDPGDPGSGSIGAEVATPGSSSTPAPSPQPQRGSSGGGGEPSRGSGGSSSGGTSSGGGGSSGGGSTGGGSGSGTGGRRVEDPSNPLDQVKACKPGACNAAPAAPPAPAPAGPRAPAAAPLPNPAIVAEAARQEVPIRIPRPHTSPDGVPQVTGLKTWYWMDPAQWAPATARAELPGLWAEVTATPTRTVWTPDDGGATVTCAGPGRRHPGTSRATTDCGHVYSDKGAYTVRVAVTYEVTWRSSTGESGTQDPIILTTNLPITVEERQVVTN